MPNKKISQLNSVDQLFGDEKLLITQSGANKTSTVPVLGTKLNSDVGAAVSGLNSQSTMFAANARASVTGIGSDLAAGIGALHRSPYAITSMFVYDTSKDSDGGAWTEKCQHTSWYNEAINGKWLGAQMSEGAARAAAANSFGSELIPEWSNSRVSIDTPGNPIASKQVTTVVGAQYLLKFSYEKLSAFSGANEACVYLNGVAIIDLGYVSTLTGSVSYGFVATTTTTTISIGGYSREGDEDFYIDNTSLREIINQTSGDYFQLTTDGKFYKLNAGSGTTEVFRGNKREFPKLSAIVAESSNVTIYDLTEPGRPMWARTVTELLRINGSFQTISAINGNICIGSGSNVMPLGIFNYPKDDLRVGVSGYYAAPALKYRRIADRNLNTGGYGDSKILTSQDGLPLAGLSVNSIAMTVLPDAPVDPVTGLQVPTIAAGTGGGLSIIRHNGTVYNITSFPSVVNFLSISGKTLYISGTFGSQSNFGFIKDIGTASPVNYYVSSGYDCAAYLAYNGYGGVRNAASKGVVAVAAPIAYAGNPISLAFQKTNFSFPDGTGSKAAQGAFAKITNSWNKGYSVGDERRAYLADNTIGSVSSAELIVNGTFDANTQGWGSVGSVTTVLTAVDGEMRLSATASDYPGAQQIVTVISGKTYLLKLKLRKISGNFDPMVWIRTGQEGGDYPNTPLGSVSTTYYQTKEFTFTAAATQNIYIQIRNGGTGITGVCAVDDVSLTDVSTLVADRSYKAKYSTVLGILTKSPVATNAQLVGYSGFSAANYLREPYSADLDFGTGEWSASAWVNIPTSFPTENPVSLTNGTFDNSLTGWTVANGAIWDASQRALLPNINASISQTISTIPGKTYKVTFTRQGWEPALLIVDGVQYSIGSTTSSAVTASQTFVAINANTSLQIKPSGSTPTYIDNVIPVQLIDNTILSREYSSGASVKIGVTAVGTITAIAYDGTITRTVTTTTAYNTATWVKAEACYTTDGTLSIRVNGQQVAATYGAPLLTLNNSNAELTIGNSYAANAPFPGSLALVKFSATVPTTEQSQWMYEQEKAMFQPGAQVCLPSSNSVTDLTYDNLTDTWIAAQSTHISEWKGLVRTSYRKPASGSFDKLSAASGVRLMTRSSWGVDIEAQPVQLKKELFSSTDASINNQNTTTFDFDAVTSQTDFVLPVGYTAQAVFSAGVQIFEGSTGNKFTRLFDGFKETIRFATAPGNSVWVKIRAVRAQG